MPHWRWEAWERELTGVGRSRPRDAWWRSELLPDDHKTWGKRNTRVWGATPPKELSNSQVAQRLAGYGWRQCSPQQGGRNGEGGELFSTDRCFYRRRRERSGRAPQVGNGRRRRTGPANRRRAPESPTPGVWQVGPQSAFESGTNQIALTHCSDLTWYQTFFVFFSI
jgi:hypothetical protein